MKIDNDRDLGSDDPQTYAVIGAAISVHNVLGHGFLEAVYQEAFALELKRLGIPFENEVALPISFRGQRLECGYRADFVCFGFHHSGIESA